MIRAFVVGLGLWVVGCSSGPQMEVRHFWYPAASPYGLGSGYAWLDGENEDGFSPDYRKLLREHVESVLQSKGYALSEVKDAGFLATTYFGRQTRSAETGLQSFDQGVIIIDFLDKPSRAPLWRGRLMTRIEYDLPPAARRKRLRIGVEKILKGLPGPRD